MRYASVCSGVGTCALAWHPLGWETAWFAEIESAPSAILAHRFPQVPNHGDMLSVLERAECIMKPSELTALSRLPSEVVGFRAHRESETDWIAYTLDPATAGRFARERGTDKVAAYGIRKSSVVALFARRREAELIVLDRGQASFRGTFGVQA